MPKMQAITNKPALLIDAIIIICIDLNDTPFTKLRLQSSIRVNWKGKTNIQTL